MLHTLSIRPVNDYQEWHGNGTSTFFVCSDHFLFPLYYNIITAAVTLILPKIHVRITNHTTHSNNKILCGIYNIMHMYDAMISSSTELK